MSALPKGATGRDPLGRALDPFGNVVAENRAVGVPREVWRWESKDWPMVHYADTVSGPGGFGYPAHPDAVRYLRADLIEEVMEENRQLKMEMKRMEAGLR